MEADVAPFVWWKGPEQRVLQQDDPLFQLGDAFRADGLLCQDGGGHGVTAETIDELRSTGEYPCSESGCSAVFTSHVAFEAHYLGAHHNETHDAMFQVLAERQPMYECFVDGCLVKLSSRRERKAHLIAVHDYPPSFNFGAVVGKVKPKQQQQKQQSSSSS
eukprot:gene28035-4098_t